MTKNFEVTPRQVWLTMLKDIGIALGLAVFLISVVSITISSLYWLFGFAGMLAVLFLVAVPLVVFCIYQDTKSSMELSLRTKEVTREAQRLTLEVEEAAREALKLARKEQQHD